MSRSGGEVVGAPGHGATGEAGPDQVTRLTVVLENPADAQVLVSFLFLLLCVCYSGEMGRFRRRWCLFVVREREGTRVVPEAETDWYSSFANDTHYTCSHVLYCMHGGACFLPVAA